jgi:hypothetical protein
MKIFIASTNLHLIDSLILNNNDILFFLSKTDNELLNLIKQKNYFKKIYTFIDDKKFSTRIKNAQKMISISKEISPDEIIVGNDRKIEISILIHNFKNNYSYMDDGLHSYILEKQYPFKYSIFEKYLKMFLYKSKLDVPKYIGCSDYIKNVYLFKPEFANGCLKKKNLQKLDIHKLPHIKMDLNIDCKNILLLPHPKFINSKIINKLSFLNDFCVKYHPRDKNRYFNAKEIGNISLEILLLNVNKDIKIYGFNTTALLIAKWLGFDSYNIVFKENEVDRFMKMNNIKEIKI